MFYNMSWTHGPCACIGGTGLLNGNFHYTGYISEGDLPDGRVISAPRFTKYMIKEYQITNIRRQLNNAPIVLSAEMIASQMAARCQEQ